MDKPNPPGDNPRPPSPKERVDQVCDRFEATWRSGTRPRIEDLLATAGLEAPWRHRLLTELVLIDLEYSWRIGASTVIAREPPGTRLFGK